MAKELAKQIGYAYIDTGAMYRAVTLYALENSIISTNCEIDKKTLIESLDKIDITFRVVESGETSHTFLNGIDVENMKPTESSLREEYQLENKKIILVSYF